MKAGIIIGHLNDKGNEGSILRTGEALGINNVFVLGELSNSIYKASKGAERHVNYFNFKEPDELLNHLLKNNQSLVCIENVNNAIDISEIENYPKNPVFITGNERLGVPKELLKGAKLCVKLTQGMGYMKCMNTSHAMAIVLYDFFQKQMDIRNKQWANTSSR